VSPNSSRDPKVGPRTKQQKKKKVGACSLKLQGQEGMLELQDGTRMNSQARIQNKINLHNLEKRAIGANRMEMVGQT